ncbi:sporangiospore maturation cell wall hydrolase GsmA [Symbioplanes lichenis]|uniref:sporangiospore maturation cell wall hydrolase GsmA n=1 Tax=Symbioplanes lichenis TaxID=1629072 RepID=UPI002739825C|nr:sporangiospore maturation cell wall hydrolase GsmA [Actinoplanes lichenis]
MSYFARRILTGPLLVAALGAGLAVAPQAANAAAGVTATVEVSSTLQIRNAPSLDAKAVDSLRGGRKVTVLCQVEGQKVRGSVRTTTAWDRLATGRYISHAYVSTTRTIPVCAVPSAAAVPQKVKAQAARRFVVGTVKSFDGKVNLRSAPSTQGQIKASVNTGRKINLVCAVTGVSVAGSVRTTAQWDKTSVGTYISHAYMYSGTLKPCPGASVPTAPAVTLTPEQFIKAAVPGAQRGWREYGVPASVTIAQAILESGWGRSGLSTADKNYFGIKCQGTSYGKLANGCHVYNTTECTKAGNCFAMADAFRTYETMAHSFRDHGSFLRVNPRYAPAFKYTKDANKFIWNVWKAGYATDPNYYTKVTGLMASWNLYQYDTWK